MSGPLPEGHELRRYLDSASGIPLSPTARTGLLAALTSGWPDPGRRYPAGRRARALLDQARASVADVVRTPPEGVLFAGGVDEAVRWLLSGFASAPERPRPHRLVVAAVEELGVLRECDRLRSLGTPVVEVPVAASGEVAVPRLVEAVAGDPRAVVVLQDSNLEVGTRQPVADVRAALPAGSPLVMDARAALGRVPLARGWDALFADPRLWGGPAGFAVVAVREPDRFRPDAARTEGFAGIEATRPPVELIAAGALALEEAAGGLARWELTALTDRLRASVSARVPDVQILGHPSARLPYLTMFSFLYVPADELVDELARRGWAVASGASCTSDTRRPHHVLVAMGALTHGSLRVSLGPWSTTTDVDTFADDLVEVVGSIRRERGAAGL